MVKKEVNIGGVGKVSLSKRRGAKSLRLSVTTDGEVKVGMPNWLPYSAAIPFIKSHRFWINDQLKKKARPLFVNGQRVGKSHILLVHKIVSERFRSTVDDEIVEVWTHLEPDDPLLQAKIRLACQKVLKTDAEKLLPRRLASRARELELDFSSIRIRKLTSRWGSCSPKKDITLSYFLVQLPWELIDYVIVHELIHTEHPYHGPRFWQAVAEVLPNHKDLRKQIKKYSPTISVE